ncbi:MAG: dipeptidase [Candidatus Nanopelagicales bacterium]
MDTVATPEQLRQRVAAGMPQTTADLEALVRIPGCAFPGFPKEEVLRAADAVVALLRDAGCPDARLLDLGQNPPAVYGEVPGPEGSPTVLLYAHYDVQPPGNLEAWHSDPFVPVIRDGRMYGRGAADDKSGVVVHAAVLRAFAGQPPCTLRIIIEGDEEFGGSFEEYPAQHPELFAADAIVIADNGNVRVGQPTFTTTLRGMANVTVSVETLAGPVHSGVFGGPAPDALMALITLLATLRDEDGDTAIAGITGSEWDGVEVPEDTYRADAGVLDGVPLVGTGSIGSRIYSKPAVSVIGIDAPAVEGAINAVVPKARAVVSLRVPPGSDAASAQQRLIEHLEQHAPWGIGVSLEAGPIGNGFVAPTEGPALAAMSRAMVEAFGEQPVNTGSGGSIPLVSVLTEVAPQAAILLVGAQDSTAAIHAPNESVDLGEVELTALTEALFISYLAEA